MAKNKEAEKTEALVQEPPAGAIVVDDFGEYANAGLDKVTKEDLKTPFIKLFQSNSKELAEGTVDAKPGTFYNTATGEQYPMSGFNALLIGKTWHYIEWKPRDSGGGYVAAHQPKSEFVRKTFANNEGRTFGKLVCPNGNELIESHDALILLLDETGHIPMEAAIFPFVSTKIDAIKNWYTKIMTTKIPGLKPDPVTKKPKRPPIFSWRSRIVGFKSPKTSKGIFYNVKVEPFVDGDWLASVIRPNEEPDLLESAAGYYDMFVSGALQEQAEAAYQKETNPSTVDAEGEGVPF